MLTSEHIAKIAPALLDAQKAIGVVARGAENPYFNSKYADLTSVIDAVKGPLNDNGIVFLQGIGGNVHEGPYVETLLLHETGEYMSTRTPVYCAKVNSPQAFGSGVTYSKRYALQALLGLPTADDDAEGAMNRKKAPKGRTRPPKDPADKPDIGMAWLEGPDGEAWMKVYTSPSKAIAAMMKTHNVPREAEAYIKEHPCFVKDAVAEKFENG